MALPAVTPLIALWDPHPHHAQGEAAAGRFRRNPRRNSQDFGWMRWYQEDAGKV